MTTKDSLPESESKPVQETTQAEQHDSEHKADVPASLPAVNPSDAEDDEPKTSESNDETNRKQDQTFAKIAEQTESEAEQAQWLKKQTFWAMAQTIATTFLGIVTLGVLIYHGLMMRGQLKATNETVEVMRGQLKSMESNSQQTQDLITATQKSADASQAIAGQNKDLVGQSGEQTKAMQTQAEASLAQAQAANKSLGIAQSSAKAAEQSASVARQAFDIGERPYVVIKEATISNLLEANKPMLPIIRIANAGRTPAQNITTALSITYGAGQVFFFGFPDDGRRPATGLFLAAGQEISLGGAPVDTIVLDDKAVGEINSGRELLYVHGKGSYSDMSGRVYTINYCFYYSPQYKNFGACSPGMYGTQRENNKK